MRFKLRDNPSHNVKKTLDLRRGGLSPIFWVNIAESYIARRTDIWLNFRIRHFGRLVNQEYFARFQYSPHLSADEIRIERAGGDPHSIDDNSMLRDGSCHYCSKNRAVFINSIKNREACKGAVPSLIRLYTPEQFHGFCGDSWCSMPNGLFGLIRSTGERELDLSKRPAIEVDPTGFFPNLHQRPRQVIESSSKVMNCFTSDGGDDPRYWLNPRGFYRLLSGVWFVIQDHEFAGVGTTESSHELIEVLDVMAGAIKPNPNPCHANTHVITSDGVIRYEEWARRNNIPYDPPLATTCDPKQRLIELQELLLQRNRTQ